MNKGRRIDFKSLSKLEQNIIYEYNSKVYCDGLENSIKYLTTQKIHEESIIRKFRNKLSDESVKRIQKYIENHRKY